MKYYCLFLLLLYLSSADGNSLRWLVISLAKARIPRDAHPKTICQQLKGLNKKQNKFCRKNVELMESVRMGTRLAYSECQYQFRHRRWNCTMINPETYEVFGEAILKKGTQEAAFVHAITAAGVAYQLTADCSRGLISRCGCDQTAQMNNNDPKKFVFSGCSDNVRYGTLSSKEFVDAGDRGKHKNNSVQRAMNLHNNNAGREVLILNMEEKCKCHGMSGSCSLKTCYKKMPSFRRFGTILKEKFDGATEVNVELEESRPVIIRRDLQFKKHTKADLVYSDPSPDFCEPDPKRGVLGTHGRRCNTSSLFPDECSQLCCNRGYRTYKRRVQRECHCKFVYCCHVECDICSTTVSEEICN